MDDNTWTSRKPFMCCSNHVVGRLSEVDASRGQSLFADGSAGREYADACMERESIPPSSAGDHLRIKQPKHLCTMGKLTQRSMSTRVVFLHISLVLILGTNDPAGSQ